jgi:hypothetical protein
MKKSMLPLRHSILDEQDTLKHEALPARHKWVLHAVAALNFGIKKAQSDCKQAPTEYRDRAVLRSTAKGM